MEKKYAIFIDGDNISPQYLDSIIAEVSKDGEILIKRIYGDWTTTNMNNWKEKVFNTPVRLFQQFRFGPNATDNSIIMDAIELSNQNRDVNSYCIVSIDSDYYSLALRLREMGKFVLGIGKENSKIIWKNSCNQFFLIENIHKIDKEKINNASVEREERDLINIEDIIEFSFENSKTNDDGWISLSDFGNTIRSRYPSFDPRTYNHRNLLQLINSFPEKIYIKNDDKTPPNYWIQKKQVDNGRSKKIGIIKKYLGIYGFIENESGNYFFTVANIAKESHGKKIKKGLKVKFNIFKEPDPTKEDASERNGKASDIELID